MLLIQCHKKLLQKLLQFQELVDILWKDRVSIVLFVVSYTNKQNKQSSLMCFLQHVF